LAIASRVSRLKLERTYGLRSSGLRAALAKRRSHLNLRPLGALLARDCHPDRATTGYRRQHDRTPPKLDRLSHCRMSRRCDVRMSGAGTPDDAGHAVARSS